MRLQKVMLKAVGGELRWLRAAEILGISPRSLRRWRERYEREGYNGLTDHRRGTLSRRRVPLETVEQVLRLYRERYRGFNGNAVVLEGRCLQLPKQVGRRTCAGLRVTVRRHLNCECSIWRGPGRLGRYAAIAHGRDTRIATPPMEAAGPVDAKSAPTAPCKAPRTRFPQLL